MCGSEIYNLDGSASLGYTSLAAPTIIKYNPNGNLNWKNIDRGDVAGEVVKIEGFTLDNAANAYAVVDLSLIHI